MVAYLKRYSCMVHHSVENLRLVMLLSYYGRTNVGIQNGSEAANMESKDTLAFIVDCI